MKNIPLVSVVMITYGHENYIIESLKGVINQIFNGKIELIISNDNSPDNTDSIIKAFINENCIPNNIDIKYIKHESNLGMMPNFFWSLNQANGDYIALCDGDDFWIEPTKIQQQVDFLESNVEYNICFHNCYIKQGDNITIDQEIERRYSLIDDKNNITYVDLIKYRNFIHTNSVVFRNVKNYDALSKINNISKIGDLLLYVFLSQSGKIKKLDFYGGVYRMGVGGYSTLKKLDRIYDRIKYLVVIKDLISNTDVKNFINELINEEFENLRKHYSNAMTKAAKNNGLMNKIIAKLFKK